MLVVVSYFGRHFDASPPSSPASLAGKASVIDDAVKHTSHYLSYSRHPRCRFFFAFVLAIPEMVVELNHIVRGGEPHLCANVVISCSVYMVRHPQGSYIVYPLLPPLDVAIPEKKLLSKLLSTCKKVRTRCRRPPHTWSLAGCSPPFVRLAEHLTVLRAWCTGCLPDR